MPNNNYGALLDTLDTHAQASGNIAGTDGVAPEQAASVISQAPLAGLPASVGMHTPDFVAQQALQRTQQDTLAASAPVARWAATADPAHLAVTKDDFPALAKISDYLGKTVGNPFQDFYSAAVTAPNAKFAEGVAKFGAKPLEGALDIGASILGAATSPLAPLNQYLKRAMVNDPSFALHDVYQQPDGSYAQGPALTSPADRERRAQDYADLGTMFILGAGRPKLPEVVGKSTPSASPLAPKLPSNLPPRPTPPGVNPEVDMLRTQVAEHDAAGVAEVQAQVAESQTHARSPQVMENFLAQSTGERTVAVDPEVLMRLGQEGTIVFPDHGPQIIEAARNGEPVQVPMSTYLARTARQPFAEELNSVSTFREGGLSVADAKEVPAPAEVPPRPPVEVPVPSDFTPEEATQTRYIAADAHRELESVVQELRLRELFTEAKAVGATKTNFERYSAGIEEQIALATERLTERAVAQVKRERTPQWKERVVQHEAAVELELADNPAIRARAYLVQGKDPTGAPIETPFKLDRADAIAMYGKDLGLPDRMFGRDGVTADEAAEVLGFRTGADMIRALAELQTAQGDMTIAQHMKAMVKAEAAQRTRDELGFDLDPEAIHQAASEAIATPAIEDFLAADLKAFADENGLPFDKAAMKAYAADRFANRPVKEAINTRKLEGFLGADSRKLETALLKGDIPAAFKWKQAQFLHQVELTLSHKFIKLYNRTDKAYKSLAKKPISASMNQEARNYARAIVAQLGYNVRNGKYESPEAALKGKPLHVYVAEQTAKGTPIVFAEIPPVAPLQMTVDQYIGVQQMVESIVNNGREQLKVYKAGEAAKLSDIVEEIKANGTAIGRQFTAGELRELKQKFAQGVPGHAARVLGSSVARPETFLYWLDGETNGPLMKYIVDALENGKYYKADQEIRMNKEWHDFIKSQPDGWRNTLDAKVDVPELLYGENADGQPVQWLQTRSDVIMLATHFGTESNFTKLTEGFGWDATTVRGVADRVLTKADWDYVQFILNQHEALLPEVQKLYRDTVGLGMDPVPATPIQTPFGTYPGGYRHISYDWSAIGEFEDETGETVEVKDPNALGESTLFGADYRVSTPANKYTIQRTQFSAPINLSHDVLNRELESVVHDLAYRKALIQAAKIMAQPAVRQTFREVLGSEYLDQTNRWLQDIAKAANYDQSQLKFFAGMVRGFRRRFTMFQIGYNIATLGKHGAIAAAHIDGEVGVARFAKASADLMGRTPENGQSLAAWVDEQSGEVRGALLNLDRDVRELIQASLREQGYLDKTRYHAFTMFGLVKQLEARATWLAKYRQLTGEDFLPHEDAVALANKSVRDTQGAGGTVDLPALWRGDSSFWSEMGKLLNVFTNFENTASNRLWTMIRSGPRMFKGFKDNGWAGGRRDFTKMIAYSKAYFIMPAVFAAAFETFTTDGGKNFLHHFYQDFLKSSLGGSIPGGSIIADIPRVVTGFVKTKHVDFGNDAITSALSDVVATGVNAFMVAKHIVAPHSGDHVDPKWAQHAAATVGYVLNLPTKPIAKASQYIWNVTHGKEKTDPVDFIRGLFFGPKLKETHK